MEEFNGVSYIPPTLWNEPDVVFSTDSCLTGCGGICGQEYFHRKYPHHILEKDLPIHALEMLAVLIAVRFWGKTVLQGEFKYFVITSQLFKSLTQVRRRTPSLDRVFAKFGLRLQNIILNSVLCICQGKRIGLQIGYRVGIFTQHTLINSLSILGLRCMESWKLLRIC